MNPVKSLPDTTIYHDLEVCEDDVWLVSNPKSGTTWMQELLWLLMNDCDYETALAKDLEVRSPFLEYVLFNKIVKHSVKQIFHTGLIFLLMVMKRRR